MIISDDDDGDDDDDDGDDDSDDDGDDDKDDEDLVLEINEVSAGTWGSWLANKASSGMSWERGESKMREAIRNYGTCTKNPTLDYNQPEREERWLSKLSLIPCMALAFTGTDPEDGLP